MKERPDENSDRTFTYEYCMLEFSYSLPTDAYQAWIGKWSVTDSDETPHTDSWTISAKSNNVAYHVKGLGNQSAITGEAEFDAETGQLIIKSQKDFTTVKTTDDNNVKVSLFGTDGSVYYPGIYDLMYAAFDDDTQNAATLSSFDMEKYPYYKLYGYVDGTVKYNFGVRSLPSSMVRVASSEIMVPDDWSLMTAEAPETEEAATVIDLTEVIEDE